MSKMIILRILKIFSYSTGIVAFFVMGGKMIYNNFAYIYDKLMYDVDYSKWADYIESIFERNSLKPELVLDLGCGTGSFTVELATRGYDMIGIDQSVDMLHCARTKAQDKGKDILYLCQDMTKFELYGTVDAIVCLMDSINYITAKNDVKKVLKLVKNYLNPGGIFIFDINSPYKFQKVLSSNLYYDISDEITYIWQNQYDSKRKLCEFDLTFFVKDGEDYKKYDETHMERNYSVSELKQMISSAGLELTDIFHHLSFKTPLKNSERIFFVVKKGVI